MENILLQYSVFGSQVLSHKRTERIAENQSLWSDPLAEYSIYFPDKSWKCIAAYGALLKQQKDEYWKTDRAVRHFAELCYRHAYDGKWRTFQEILERTSNYEEYMKVTEELLGGWTVYGNLVRLIEVYGKTIQPKRYDQNRRRVRKPRRRRGYNDKGSLRPEFKRGRNLPDPNAETEDRRSKVKHPLLNEQNRGGGERLGPHSPEIHPLLELRKEVNLHDSGTDISQRSRNQESCPDESRSSSWTKGPPQGSNQQETKVRI